MGKSPFSYKVAICDYYILYYNMEVVKNLPVNVACRQEGFMKKKKNTEKIRCEDDKHLFYAYRCDIVKKNNRFFYYLLQTIPQPYSVSFFSCLNYCILFMRCYNEADFLC